MKYRIINTYNSLSLSAVSIINIYLSHRPTIHLMSAGPDWRKNWILSSSSSSVSSL